MDHNFSIYISNFLYLTDSQEPQRKCFPVIKDPRDSSTSTEQVYTLVPGGRGSGKTLEYGLKVKLKFGRKKWH